MDETNTGSGSGIGSGSPSPSQPGSDGQGTPVPGGQVLDLDIQRELQDSYLTYAMSTIMDRALPDVRDGLKPSQRRILVAMNDLNLRPGKQAPQVRQDRRQHLGRLSPARRSDRLPHSRRHGPEVAHACPLIDPQGNFGSINGDPPAAMRYTEARMTYAAVDMLADLELDTVDFQPNYDDRLMEPTVLPGRFPNLLINGGIGIAVGMATSLPPHNPTRSSTRSSAPSRPRSDAPAMELMTDVGPTAGPVVRRGQGPRLPHRRQHSRSARHRRGLQHRTRAGHRARHRARRGIDKKLTASSSSSTRSPTTAPEALLKKIVEAVEEDRIQDVSDVRDESGREAATRIVIELKRGADPRVVEKQLYEFTSLQDTFSIMNIALVNRQPRTLSLRELIDLYIGPSPW
jgi:DNA gyrase subunit A